MTLHVPRFISRRRILVGGLAIPIPFLLGAACGGGDGGDSSATSTPAVPTAAGGQTPASTSTSSAAASPTTAALAPTPVCADGDDPTPAQTEGPFFTPDSPERTVLFESGMAGTKLLLVGSVVSTGCQPIAQALVDFWQCDDAGDYDNAGYTLRGHQFTDADGHYRLETVVPGLYPGRTRHIHVNVQPPNGSILTTQLYFPGEARNQQDGIYREECLVADYKDGSDGKEGVFTFVLDA
ncbi:MAG: dioxygenase [Dehalococcoidia bacterium]